MIRKKFKNCPFCDGNNIVVNHLSSGFFVQCETCKSNTGSYDNEEKAIKAWNTRNPISKIIKDIEELKPVIFEIDTNSEIRTKKAVTFALRQVISLIVNRLC